MLNEGLHIEDVGAVILLRTTESPRIFYQQIGRCLHVDSLHNPIVFDFVNNFRSIRANDFLSDLNDAKAVERLKREKLGLSENCPDFTIIDESKDILDIFAAIQSKLESWEIMFDQLKQYIEIHGHSSIPREEDAELSYWATDQRVSRNKGHLTKNKVDRLNKINFDWNPVESRWIENYEKLLDYRAKYGNCNVGRINAEFYLLGAWVANQRRAYKDGFLPEERIKLLDEVGFIWGIKRKEFTWQRAMNELKEYKKIFGHTNVSQLDPKYRRLGRWVNDIRSKWKGRLPKDFVAALDELGFSWNPREDRWHDRLKELKQFYDENGNFLVGPHNKKFPHLGFWAIQLRKKRPRKDRYQELLAIGYDWEIESPKRFKTMEKENEHSHPDDRV